MQKHIYILTAVVVLGWAFPASAAPTFVTATFVEYPSDFFPPTSSGVVVTEIIKVPVSPDVPYSPNAPSFYDYLPGFTNFEDMLSWSIIDDPHLSLDHIGGYYPYDKLIVSETPFLVWLQTHQLPGTEQPTTEPSATASLTATSLITAPLTVSVPEPATLTLAASFLLTLAAARFFRGRRQAR